MRRNNTLLRRLPTSKQVQLPNSQVFSAKYQQVGRHSLALSRVRIAELTLEKSDRDGKELEISIRETDVEEGNKPGLG